jgi:hypothetical protein|tara:strand:- start:802 stop:981 length:180 start_codon:yes stop_codon:yes gene_type:complete
MTKGFDVDFDMSTDEIDKLLKEYKKIKKYQKSNLFTIKSIDGTEDVVSKMVEEASEGGF